MLQTERVWVLRKALRLGEIKLSAIHLSADSENQPNDNNKLLSLGPSRLWGTLCTLETNGYVFRFPGADASALSTRFKVLIWQ